MTQWIPPIFGLLVGAILAWLLNSARGRVRAAAAEAREAEVRRELERTREEAKAISTRLTVAENSRVALTACGAWGRGFVRTFGSRI